MTGKRGEQILAEKMNSYSEEGAASPSREEWTDGIREIQEFLETINGRKTRWPMFLLAGLAVLCALVFLMSCLLSNRTQLAAGLPAERTDAVAAPLTTASLEREVRDLLAAVKGATESERTQRLLSLLDAEDQEFVAEQETNAQKLFEEFDDIEVSYSEIQIGPIKEDRVVVNLRLRLNGLLVKTGRAMKLNFRRALTLRKTEDQWKICAVE